MGNPQKEFFTRIQHKHDTETNWRKATNFIPLQGEIIIYDIDENHDYERIKVGDGINNISNLSFLLYKEIDNINLITVEDIDSICGTTIYMANEVIF